MTKTSVLHSIGQWPKALVTTGLLVWLLAGYSQASTPVILMPVPKPQFFDNAGRPLAFGCIFTYAINSTTPLDTYSDNTGNTLNQNPVILTAGGFTATASNGIWLQAGLAYTIQVRAAGGTKCAFGATQYTIDGIGGGATTLTTNVTYSTTPVFTIQAQNQLFRITLTGDASAQPLTAVGIIPPGIVTWEITQDNVGGHLFTWPSNSTGGAPIGLAAGQVTTQMFIWNGTTAEAIGPGMADAVPSLSRALGNFAGDITAVADITAGATMHAVTFQQLACATPTATAGTIELCKTGSINWRNNANSGNGGIAQDASDRGTWSFAGGFETTGTIPDIFLGGTTASFPRLKRNGTAINFRLGDDSGDAPITASTGGFSGVITSSSNTYALGGAVLSDPGAAAASTMRGYFKNAFGWCAEDSGSVVYCTQQASKQSTPFSFSTCVTSGGALTSSCSGTASLPSTQPDILYDLTCTVDSGVAATGGTCTNANSSQPCPVGLVIFNKTTTNFGYHIVNIEGVSTGSGAFGTANCVIAHP